MTIRVMITIGGLRCIDITCQNHFLQVLRTVAVDRWLELAHTADLVADIADEEEDILGTVVEGTDAADSLLDLVEDTDCSLVDIVG